MAARFPPAHEPAVRHLDMIESPILRCLHHPPGRAVAFAAPVLHCYAEANHDFGYELGMRVGQVILQRLQATRAKLADFYAAIKDD